MKKRGHLIIFVKEPRVGKVKTRLADDIGPINATFGTEGSWTTY